MKRYVWLPLILMAVFGSAAMTTKAQSVYALRAKVPFDFIVGDRPLQAGNITVRRVSSSNSGALSISNFDKSQHAMRIAHPLSSANGIKRAKLVFNKYGDRYYLAQIWVPDSEALAFTKSKSERALARETMLATNTKPEVVTIMAELQ